MIPFMTASFIIAGAFIGDFMGVVDVASTEMVGVNPIQDACTQIAHIFPLDLQETALLTINLFAGGMIYYATAETLASQGQGQRPPSLEFVKNYAQGTLDLVEKNTVNAFLYSLLSNKLEGRQLSNEQFQQLVAATKIIMLSLALALIYKTETGWLTEKEFAGLLTGETILPKGEIGADLVAAIRALLDSLPTGDPTNPLSRENVLIAMLAYLGSNPPVEELLNPQKTFAKVVEELPRPPQQG